MHDELHGIAGHLHGEVKALKAHVLTSGLDWATVLDLIRQYGPQALAIIGELLRTKPAPVPVPPTPPAV